MGLWLGNGKAPNINLGPQLPEMDLHRKFVILALWQRLGDRGGALAGEGCGDCSGCSVALAQILS
jgi:hypothetical protein